MTSPISGGSEHVSRYRALGEFDSLIRAARDAKRALRELREEEAKLNAQSLRDDKKVTASKQERAKAEKSNVESIKKALDDLVKANAGIERTGERAATYFAIGFRRGVEKSLGNVTTHRAVEAGLRQLYDSFTKVGEQAGNKFQRGFNKSMADSSFKMTANGSFSGISFALTKKADDSGKESGERYNRAFTTKLKALNNLLSEIGLDQIDLDIDIEDARQEIAALEYELKQIANTTDDPKISVDTTLALKNLRAIQKLFKDEISEEIIKDSKRVQKELDKLDKLPSGKAFKFWALTALSDMARVFEEAEKGTSVFEKLRRSIAENRNSGNFFKSFVEGFNKISESTSNVLQRLSRVSGVIYKMPGLIAATVSALPALIAGVGAVAGGAGALASGLGAVVGVLAAGPGVIAAFAGAIGGLSGVVSNITDIMKSAKIAQEEEAMAKEKARLGTDKALTGLQKYQAQLKELNPATRKVTEAIVEFSRGWAMSQDRISDKFFKELVGSTDRLNKLLPITENFFGKSATALGKLADQGLKMITSGPWKRDFAIIADNNAKVIDNMGKAGFSLVNVFRNIAVAAGPFTGWLTTGIKNAAKEFENWSARARANGGIGDFLDETKESLESVWQIVKNLGSVVNSFFQSTVDEGQKYLVLLENITGEWADIAKAQEAANSPLRKWLENIRPLLSAMGALIGDLARGLGKLASDQKNINTMIDLLNVLRTEVLPPIFRILQQLSDSGIATVVAKALGSLLNALADFLESGATTALTVFITVLAKFAEILFGIASLPGISTVLGAVASGLAAIAAVAVVARFTGLFKLWEFFTWMTTNRGNLSGAFADAARGVAGLPTSGNVGTQQPIRNVPSTIGPIGAEALGGQARAIDRVGTSAGNAAGKVSLFSRAVSGITVAGGAARGAMSSLGAFLGGPWGIAIGAAVIGVGLLANSLTKQKQEAEDTRAAFLALKNAYGTINEGDVDQFSQLAETDTKLKDIIRSAQAYGLSLKDVSGALNNQQQSLSRVNAQLDTQIAIYKSQPRVFEDNTSAIGLQGRIQNDLIDNQIKMAEDYKRSINETAAAQAKNTSALNSGVGAARSYEERLAGMTEEQVATARYSGELTDNIRLLSNALDTMASATATNVDRSKALADIINYQNREMIDSIESVENFQSSLLDLTDAVTANGKSLSVKSREGLRNRDALQASAKATRDLFLADIASGKPMDESIKRHQARIKELQTEANRLGLNEKETRKLIKAYGDIPDDVQTLIKTDKKGFKQVFEELQQLQFIQYALKNGMDPDDAAASFRRSKAAAAGQYPQGSGSAGLTPRGDGPGFATGGPVWGAGTRTSDSIRAWLSNGEFVQPTDAVEHYGLPIMEALRRRELSKDIIAEALPDRSNTPSGFSQGGAAHGHNCVACESGGHKFASGGMTAPITVNPKNTKIDKDWAYNIGDLGGASGGGGWKWQMAVLRRRFPGLELWSGYRPGSTTLTGNRSYHASGRAVDVAPRRDVAQWIRSTYGARTKELITPWNELNLHNGRPHRYTGAVWNQHNFAGGNAHNHWAFNKGGMVDLMKMLNMNNLTAPSQPMNLPETPRTLSPAASSVVTNNTEAGTKFGDVIINNPLPERAGDSVRNSLYRTAFLI